MNNEKMKNHLKNADMDKLAAVIEIKKAYNDGKYNPEVLQLILKKISTRRLKPIFFCQIL